MDNLSPTERPSTLLPNDDASVVMRRESARGTISASYLCAFAGGISLFIALPAQAAPPPPPDQANLDGLQRYIRGLDKNLPDVYRSALADDIDVAVDGKTVARSKTEWTNSTAARFTAGGNYNVTIEQVFYGGVISQATGELEARAILVERAVRVFGDCCVYHRVETLVFRHGLVISINRSTELDLQLKNNGHRQDEPPNSSD